MYSLLAICRLVLCAAAGGYNLLEAWFHVQLWRATRCNNCRLSNKLESQACNYCSVLNAIIAHETTS